MDAGRLDRRLRFEAREVADDGFGNTVSGEWAGRFTVPASRTYLRGGEAVMAGRLAGRQAAVLSVRATARSRGIASDWRAVDVLSGEVFNLRGEPRLSADRAMLDMDAESGVAT